MAPAAARHGPPGAAGTAAEPGGRWGMPGWRLEHPAGRGGWESVLGWDVLPRWRMSRPFLSGGISVSQGWPGRVGICQRNLCFSKTLRSARSDRAEPCPCDSRERRCAVTSLGSHCHTSQGRQWYIPWKAEPRPRDSRLRQCNCHIPGKATSWNWRRNCHIPREAERSTLRTGDTSSSVLTPRSGLPSSPGSPHAWSGLCTMPCSSSTNFLGDK